MASIKKNPKTKKWEARFYTTDCFGQKKQHFKRGFRTKKEAKEYVEEFQLKNEGSIDTKFSDFVERYFKDKEPSWKRTTYSTTYSKVKTWILPYFKDKKLSAIKPRDILNWQNELKRTDLSQTTLKKIWSVMTALFNHAVKFYDLNESPCKRLDSMGTYKRSNINFWTHDEFKEFIKLVDNPHLALAYKTLYYTGLRIGELVALTPSDFDFSVPKLSVTKSLQIIDRVEYIDTPKTSSSIRDVILPQKLADEIEEYIKKTPGLTDNERIFYYNKKTYGNRLTQICNENNFKRIRLHDLRHSHASHLIELGFDPLLIKERLGHENVQITLQIYSHLYPNKQDLAANELDKIFE